MCWLFLGDVLEYMKTERTKEIEKVINSTISDDSIKNKAKSIVSKVKELENISSFMKYIFCLFMVQKVNK